VFGKVIRAGNHIDGFAEGVAKVRENDSLMQLLAERSKETAGFSLSQVREQLQGKKRSTRKGQK
jgi:hypothetical protein